MSEDPARRHRSSTLFSARGDAQGGSHAAVVDRVVLQIEVAVARAVVVEQEGVKLSADVQRRRPPAAVPPVEPFGLFVVAGVALVLEAAEPGRVSGTAGAGC